MWLGAKLTFRKLLHDDSGVAMAYTVLVSLFIFMLCVSTYAMSENIRKKMELQNACDAAAYSGAVVQADMLSRLAVLNRALSWTYAETNKRQMDYIVDKWATSAWYTYDNYRTNAKANATSCSECMISTQDNSHNGRRCGCGDISSPAYHSYGWGLGGYYTWTPLGNLHCWYVGTPDGNNPRRINFNGTATPAEAGMPGFNVENNIRYDFDNLGRRTDSSEATQISNGKTNIRIINSALDGIRRNMNQLICNAIHSSMTTQRFDNYRAYVDGTWARPTAGGTSSLTNGTAASYIGWENSETTFLSFSGNTPGGAFQAGHNSWWTLTDDNSGDDRNRTGIVRNYTRGLVASIAAWAYRHSHWSYLGTTYCVAANTYSANRNFDASTLSDECFSGETAFPVKLRRGFWGQNGSLIVAAQIPASNPFSVAFNGTGLYANAVWGGRRNTFAVSAARAGLRFQNAEGVSDGAYSVQYPGDNSTGSLNASTRYNRTGVWNLCEEDWDAVMLPLQRAWCNTTPGAWANYAPGVRYSASAILNAAARQFNASDSLFDNNAINNFVHH